MWGILPKGSHGQGSSNDFATSLFFAGNSFNKMLFSSFPSFLSLTGLHWYSDENYQGKKIENYSDEDHSNHRPRADSDKSLPNGPRQDHASNAASHQKPACHGPCDMHSFLGES